MELMGKTNNRNSYNHIEYIGNKFGKLTVKAIDVTKRNENGHQLTRFCCECECGNMQHLVAPYALIQGHVKSCGCGKQRKSTKRHGMSNKRIYVIWKSMLARCKNPKSKSYKNYGERGIKVCDRWNEFENFYADMGESYYSLSKEIGEENVSIERNNINDGYNIENCTWIHVLKQGANKQKTNWYFFEGKNRTTKEIAEMLGMNYNTFRRRLTTGWSFDKAISIPVEVNPSVPYGSTIDAYLLKELNRYVEDTGLTRGEVIEDLIRNLIEKYNERKI